MTTSSLADLERAAELGFRAFEWVRFAESPAGPSNAEWKPAAERVAAEAAARGLRLTAIVALYANPLDPAQTAFARAAFQRAIEVAAHLGVRTVAGAGGSQQLAIAAQPCPESHFRGETGACSKGGGA